MSDMLTAFGLFVLFRGPRSTLPPSGLPAISPSRREITLSAAPCAFCPIIEEMDALREQLEREIELMDIAEFRHG